MALLPLPRHDSIDPVLFSPMTAIINTHFAPNVRVLQTSQILETDSKTITGFDVHPDHADPELMVQLQNQFQLPHPLIVQKQVHQNRAIEYSQKPTNHFKHRVDACYTRQSGHICAVMTADCLPVLMADKNGHWVAALHCGWRSLFQNIIPMTFQKIGANPKFTQVYLGPCIQQDAYQVDEDFVNGFTKKHPDCEAAFTTISAGKSHANLQQIARIQLEKLGIVDIMASTDCTHDMTNKYHSWRRDQSTKRMASLVWLLPDSF